MLNLKNLYLEYNNKKIFDNISLIIDTNEKIGLVGLNGSGKTTLLKAITQKNILDSGEIRIKKGLKVAYMPQEVVLDSNLSVLEETLTGFSEMYEIEKEVKRLENLLEDNIDEKLFQKYTNLYEKLLEFPIESLKAETKRILNGLGFSNEKIEEPVSNFSVGWKMRIVLAKLILQNADFYLFDEPTNHLDIIAKEWFLDFLKYSEFGFILICHEKYFMDELCDKVLSLEYGKAKLYTGNYTDFLIKKEIDDENLQSAYLQQKKEFDKKKKVIDKFKAGTRAKQAKSMEKALNRIEKIEIPPDHKKINFSIPKPKESGKLVLKVNNLEHKFENKLIFKNISFEIPRGKKFAIIAPNGVGKSTLFNLISKRIPIQKGTIEFGYNVEYSIFAQDQNKELNMNISIFENIKNICPNSTDQQIRSLLGAFLFSGEDSFKKSSFLSGGERNRVGMVGVLLKNSNLLLLDEPTNHLDIPSKEILLEALKDFSGTILFISHDRDFVNDLATDIIELTPNKCIHFEGNYDDYNYYKKNLKL
jgi:ATP-binding cassette subfamily F protein 3